MFAAMEPKVELKQYHKVELNMFLFYFSLCSIQKFVWSVSCLVLLFVKLVDDDTDQQVQGEEGAEHDEQHEVEIEIDRVLSVRLLVQL